MKNAISLALLSGAAASPHLFPRQDAANATNATLDDYISTQFDISLAGALANIGGTNDSVVAGASKGVVVASPSKINPDYFFTWTRDSALTYLMIADELIFGTESVGNNSLQIVIEDYTTSQAYLQTVSNPSGPLWPAGQGLAEPKFYTNLTRYTNVWGRPQNDGPAFRASTFMEVAEAIFQRNPNATDIVSELYWPLILNDLNYVGQYWNTSGYDPWEEVNGNSFFTMTAHHRALVQGQILAERINQTCEACAQAPNILCFLKNNFWNETGGYLLANVNANQVNRSQIGVDPLLGAMHAFDINATCDAGPMQPCNSYVFSTHKVVVDSFRDLYPINENATAPAAVAVGRYPEDTYYTGNPWYITTLACAEVLYDAVAQINQNGTLYIDNTSLPFFTDIYPDAEVGNFTGDALDNITSAVLDYADGFMAIVQKYTPENGTLNEQINKTNGEPLSAIALTWSYAAFVTASERRNSTFPPSWGATTEFANNGSETCRPGSYNATYQYAVAEAIAPANATAGPDTRCMKQVVLIANYTSNGGNVFIAGNITLLGGSTNLSEPIQPLRTGLLTASTPYWNLPAWLNSSTTVEYRYALQNYTLNSFLYENETRTVTVGACDGFLQRVIDEPVFPGDEASD